MPGTNIVQFLCRETESDDGGGLCFFRAARRITFERKRMEEKREGRGPCLAKKPVQTPCGWAATGPRKPPSDSKEFPLLNGNRPKYFLLRFSVGPTRLRNAFCEWVFVCGTLYVSEHSAEQLSESRSPRPWPWRLTWETCRIWRETWTLMTHAPKTWRSSYLDLRGCSTPTCSFSTTMNRLMDTQFCAMCCKGNITKRDYLLVKSFKSTCKDQNSRSSKSQ